jgi:peptidoglycan/LPS O-acetylase OafA/YrhL
MMPNVRFGDAAIATATAERSGGHRRQARPRLMALDGLRITAALAVVLYHYASTADKYWAGGGAAFPYLRPVANYGWLGVDLFFLISGFVICMSTWDRGLSDFFASRISRLYPAYWTAVLFTTAVVWALPTDITRLRPAQIAANLTMVQSALGVPDVDGPYWTLWPELAFYLLFAIVVWRGVNYQRAVIFCISWTALSAISWTSDNALVQVLTPHYSMYFTAGIAIYLMYRFRPTPLLWGIVGFSWLLALYGLAARVTSISHHIDERLRWSVAAGVVTLCFAIMIAAGLGKLNRITWRFLPIAGALTYPLYLIHQNAGYSVIAYLSDDVPKGVLLPGLVLAMLLLSWTIHRVAERPAAAWMRPALKNAFTEIRGVGSSTLPAQRGGRAASGTQARQ